MHAVVVRVNVSDPERATEELRAKIVPGVSQAPGFVAGYWTRSGDGGGGVSMVVFESEDAARAMADQVPKMLSEAVQLQDVEVREVVASA